MISIIAAVAANRAIGNDNKLIYWLPDDLKRFKALTTGHTIIMGRLRVVAERRIAQPPQHRAQPHKKRVSWMRYLCFA